MITSHARELKSVMPLSHVSSSSHRIGILMSDAGRFVSCIDCHMSFSFPDGMDYAKSAKQFEEGRCTGPVLPKEDAVIAGAIKACVPTLETLNHFDFDRNATPMWVFDNGTLACSAVNDAAIHDYGYSRKEFLSMTAWDIRASYGAAPLFGDLSYKGIHDPAKVLGKHEKKDGRMIDVEVTRCEVLFNGCVADLVIAVDVTRYLSIPPDASSS
jgi:hypothetical protein